MLNLARLCCKKPKTSRTTLIGGKGGGRGGERRGGEGFFHGKIDFILCLNSFVQDYN